MYSRSYGIAENGERGRQSLTVPPDYNGSMYPRRAVETEKQSTSESESSAVKAPPQAENDAAEVNAPRGEAEQKAVTPQRKETAAVPKEGILGGLFDKISVDDLVMFGLLFLLLTGETENSISLLPVLLAILLI